MGMPQDKEYLSANIVTCTLNATYSNLSHVIATATWVLKLELCDTFATSLRMVGGHVFLSFLANEALPPFFWLPHVSLFASLCSRLLVHAFLLCCNVYRLQRCVVCSFLDDQNVWRLHMPEHTCAHRLCSVLCLCVRRLGREPPQALSWRPWPRAAPPPPPPRAVARRPPLPRLQTSTWRTVETKTRNPPTHTSTLHGPARPPPRTAPCSPTP